MRRWDFWGWVAYGSIALAAFIEALSEAIKRAELSQTITALPAFFTSANWAFAPLALVALGTAILVSIEIGWIKPRQYVGQTDLQVQINAASLMAQHLSSHNIRAWYFLHHTFTAQDQTGKIISTQRQWTAFVSFEYPAITHQIIVEGGGHNLPIYEIKQTTSLSTIIQFQGDIAGMTLTIRALNN